MIVRILAIQRRTVVNREQNLKEVQDLLQARRGQADIAILPEMFDCPYENRLFSAYADPPGGGVECALSKAARDAGMMLVAGSVPERDKEKLYNTCYVFDAQGTRIARHRKIHLFDVDIPGEITFRESDTLSAGDGITVFDTPFGRAGVCICFDLRFPELFSSMAKAGVSFIFVPAAFNTVTGPAHWELLFRTRALDNQLYVVGCSPARDMAASYHAYGHTLAVDPWGTVIGELDEHPGELLVTLDTSRITRIRSQIPIGNPVL